MQYLSACATHDLQQLPPLLNWCANFAHSSTWQKPVSWYLRLLIAADNLLVPLNNATLHNSDDVQSSTPGAKVYFPKMRGACCSGIPALPEQ